jgi:hypothetical protein
MGSTREDQANERACQLLAGALAREYPPAVTRAAIPVRLGRLMALPLTFCLVTLTSLCHASPPDPTWIAGLYDDGDHDDVVLDVTGAMAVPPALPPHVAAPAETPAAPGPLVHEAPSKRSVVAPVERAPPPLA